MGGEAAQRQRQPRATAVGQRDGGSSLKKALLDVSRAYASVWEEEVDAHGALVPTAVVFLTNKQCPFECVMCDLWVNTLDERVPLGAIPRQITDALGALPQARQVKLYNAGSFFDPNAIPPEDDDAIVRAVAGVERVIVEAHPAFLTGVYGERCLRLRDAIAGRLEVAIGLETAHPDVLARLNKKMTLESFRRAAGFLAGNAIDLRVFILLKPPFMEDDGVVEWARRSIDVAQDCGATVCSVIPTRTGNDAMPAGFRPPSVAALEDAVEYGVTRSNGRVFADLWDIGRFFDCACSADRAERLRAINRTQRIPPPVACAHGC
jgi:radical SAM enzyme (TIGR01210 family)